MLTAEYRSDRGEFCPGVTTALIGHCQLLTRDDSPIHVPRDP